MQLACDYDALSFTKTSIYYALDFEVVKSHLFPTRRSADITNGIPVQLWTCSTTNTALQFIPTAFTDGSRSLTSVEPNPRVDVTGSPTLASDAIQQYDCNGTSAQKFTKVAAVIADTTSPSVP